MTSLEALRALHISEIGLYHDPALVHSTGREGRNLSEIEDFQKISILEIYHSVRKPLWNVYSSKIIMFPDSFRVLCDRFADTRSGMTSLEALRALHISEIGL